MEFFEVKIKYDKTMDDGLVKKVSETYGLQVMSFTEAESRITEEIAPYITGEFEVTHEKRAQWTECRFNGGDRYYLVKFILIYPGDDGKEKRHPMHVLFQEESIDRAKEHAREYMAGSMTDYEIQSIKETDILDVFMYDRKE